MLTEAVDCADPVRARRLRGEVVEAYLPSARSIARRYAGRGVDRSDLDQLASIGLVKAANRWRPGLSDDFLQFAVPTMVGEIKRYFRDHSFTVRPTRRVRPVVHGSSKGPSTRWPAVLLGGTAARAAWTGNVSVPRGFSRPRNLVDVVLADGRAQGGMTALDRPATGRA